MAIQTLMKMKGKAREKRRLTGILRPKFAIKLLVLRGPNTQFLQRGGGSYQAQGFEDNVLGSSSTDWLIL